MKETRVLILRDNIHKISENSILCSEQLQKKLDTHVVPYKHIETYCKSWLTGKKLSDNILSFESRQSVWSVKYMLPDKKWDFQADI